MSRKMIWCYTLLLLGVFAGLLLVINPAIAATPVGFSIVFLAGLGALQLADWITAYGVTRHRRLVAISGIFLMAALFTAMGAPAWSGFSTFLIILAFGTHYATRKKALTTDPMEEEEERKLEQRLKKMRADRAARLVA